MINLKLEIETFLNSHWCNINDKEQNMQGRLYAYFLRFEQQGYIIEMETSIQDEHVAELFKTTLGDGDQTVKKEIDLFIHNSELTENYAAELKWIYNRTKGWNVVDHLTEFEKDAKFCRWLVEKHDTFKETCSVVVYDFDSNKQVKRFSPKLKKEEKLAFLAGSYPPNLSQKGKIESGNRQNVEFCWQKLENQVLPGVSRDYYYYIISFENKFNFINKVANRIEKIYGFRMGKCISLVEQASIWNNTSNFCICQPNIDEAIDIVCREIDKGTII